MTTKYDLLEAMGGIRDQYIEEASGVTSGAGGEPLSDVRDASAPAAQPAGHPARKRSRILRMQRWAAAAAAVLCLSVLLPNVSPGAASAFQGIPLLGTYFRVVTFRSYDYQSEKADAHAEEPAIVTMAAGDVKVEDTEESGESMDTGGLLTSGAASGEGNKAGPAPGTEDSEADTVFSQDLHTEEDSEAALADEAWPEEDPETDPANETRAGEAAEQNASGEFSEPDASLQASLSAAQITEEIRQMSEQEISAFEKSIAEETGFHSLRFSHETVTDTDRWFCLEVYAYTSAADGFEEVTHFNIDKKTGKRVTLESWFGEETDYITPISENIRSQMRARMAADPDVEYWIDSEDEPEYDFTQILPDQDCYFDTDGNLVICFNEGEAAPMYMGTTEFTIPQEITAGLRQG